MSHCSSFIYSKTNLWHTLISFIKDISLIITKSETGTSKHTVPFSKVEKPCFNKIQHSRYLLEPATWQGPLISRGYKQSDKTVVKFNASRQNIRCTCPSENFDDSVEWRYHDSLGQHDLQANMYGYPWATIYSRWLTHPAHRCRATHQYKLTVTKPTPRNISSQPFIKEYLTPIPAAVSHDVMIVKPVMTYLRHDRKTQGCPTEMLSHKPSYIHWEPSMHFTSAPCLHLSTKSIYYYYYYYHHQWSPMVATLLLLL